VDLQAEGMAGEAAMPDRPIPIPVPTGRAN